MKPTAEEARVLRDRIQRDPAWFCREILGCDPYDRQIEMIESVRDREQTSVNGANGVGKDWMIGRIVCWWMAAHADTRQAKVIVTGPTYRQIADIVWRETRDAYNNSRVPLGGRMLPSEAKWDCGDQFFALGFSTDRAWNITGFHSPHLLVVVSEAHNYPDDAMVAIKRLHPERLLLSGNPFSQSGDFFESHHGKRHLYNAITISAIDSPNVREHSERVPGVVTERDIAKMAEDWGEASPFFRATVNAEFAETEDGLLPLKWLTQAATDPLDTGGEVHAGLDVAGPGDDETVLVVRRGPDIVYQHGWREPDPRGEVVAALAPYRDRLIVLNVDSAGIGYYMAQHLRDQGLNVREVNVGESPSDGEKYRNLKAELYWGLRMRFQSGDVGGLVDDLAISQLASIRYGHNSRGQVQIESKDDARKRGVKSPDRAEAIMLAFAYGDGRDSTAELVRKFEGRDEQGLIGVLELDRRADMERGTSIANREW